MLDVEHCILADNAVEPYQFPEELVSEIEQLGVRAGISKRPLAGIGHFT